MARIMIVDDHPLVRTGFSQLIGDTPDLEVCGEAGDMASALQLLDSITPDLAIVDLSLSGGSLSGGSGLDLIEHIRARNNKILILVASMHDESLYAERVLAVGAHGYINKQEAQEKIILAIRLVLSGKVYLSEKMTERMLNKLVSGTDDKHGIQSLSNRELQVFEMIGQGIAPGKMAKQLNLSVKTIETHQAHIKKKLGLTSAHKLTHRAIRWVLEREQ
jgi:DNA-binding NarL/FixJ family response regulator